MSITAISVEGFKSIRDLMELEIGPLTLIAGANSSGKSSVMQPLLLLKQTLDAPADPGPLLIAGPNAKFTEVQQMLWKGLGGDVAQAFSIGVRCEGEFGTGSDRATTFSFSPADRGIQLDSITYPGPMQLMEGMPAESVEALVPDSVRRTLVSRENGITWKVVRDRFLLHLAVELEPGVQGTFGPGTVGELEDALSSIIHLPALRGNPVRFYQTAGVGPRFPGTFENYVASLLLEWKRDRDDRIGDVGRDLRRLGLTWKVEPQAIDDTRVALLVGRLPEPVRGGARDLVNIADVGFGASQTLPVLIALRAASPGQLLFVEQPEIHLHPRAQAELGLILIEAARRGVRVVAETHSALLLRSIQAQVAAGLADPELVRLHWLQRDSEGVSRASSAELDRAGAYGGWPVDFADVELQVEDDYLTAAFREGE